MARPRKNPLPASDVEPEAPMDGQEAEAVSGMVECLVMVPNLWTHEGKFYFRDKVMIPAAEVEAYGEKVFPL